jgi:hypothetical protein
MQITRRTALAGLAMSAVIRPSFAAAEQVTYLFPAPSFLPAFMPFHIAVKRGYFTPVTAAPMSPSRWARAMPISAADSAKRR